MTFFVLLASLILGSHCPVHANDAEINAPGCGKFPTTTLIVNGTVAHEAQFPWMVFINVTDLDAKTDQCAGSIFTKRHILTTAHCLTSEYGIPAEITVLYGNNDWSVGEAVKVKKWIRHPLYDHVTLSHDIAVLLVEKPFQFASNIRPICIPTVPMDIYNTLTVVAGWGAFREELEAGVPRMVRYTTLKILPNNRCSSVYPVYDKKVMYCAYRKSTGPCTLDEGGPLMVPSVRLSYVQVGIYSFGEGCARLATPSVYTRVDAFLPWLKQVVHSLRSSDEAYSEQVPLRLASYTVPQWPFFSVPL